MFDPEDPEPETPDETPAPDEVPAEDTPGDID